jgi:acyl-CoA thioesterase I
MQPVNLFAIVLTLLGPQTPASEKPKLQIKAGDQIVAIGDSITQAGGYLRAMDAVLAQQYPDLKLPKIINVGISGQKAEDLVARFEKDVVARKPAIVTISIGINDVWHRMKDPPSPKVLADYQANVEKMVKMAQDAKIRVYLVAPTVIGEEAKSEGNVRLEKYIAAGKEIAKRHKCTYVDLHAAFLKAIADHSKQHPDATPKPKAAGGLAQGFLTSDGVHMLPLGDAFMAAGILRAMGVPDEKVKATDLSKVFPDLQKSAPKKSATKPSATR